MSGHGLADVWPLAPMQKGMLFHSAYDHEATDVYRGQVIFDLRGRLDIGALQRAGRALLRRHATLRAGFRTLKSGEAAQFVLREVDLPWQEVDLHGTTEPERARRLDEVMNQEWSHRFVLAEPPLMRLTAIRLDEERSKVVLTVHHILCDGWSTSIIANELIELYRRSGDDSTLPPATPYPEYLAWLGRQDLGAARTAWREALRDSEPTIMAPAKGDRTPVDPDEIRVELTTALATRLQEQARIHGLTMSTVMRGAWALLLGRLTDRRDVVFGGTTAGRPPELPGIDIAVGMFINTLPVRARWREDERMLDLLVRMQKQQAVLLPHEHLTLSEVQGLAGARELFDTLTVFQNYPIDLLDLHETTARAVGEGLTLAGVGGRDATHYPLTFTAMPQRFRLTYRPDLFDKESAEELVSRLLLVLERLAATPDARIGELGILLEGERSRLVEGVNVGGVGVVDATVPGLFGRVVARSRDEVAVVDG
ncbi:condensation domain-containing protein, partial [Spirillospora sp. NPDC052269]